MDVEEGLAEMVHPTPPNQGDADDDIPAVIEEEVPGNGPSNHEAVSAQDSVGATAAASTGSNFTGNNAAADDDAPTAAAAPSDPSPPSNGLEVINDDADGPPLPIGMIQGEDEEGGNKKSGVEHIEEDEGPEDLSSAMVAASIEQTTKTNTLVHEIDPPGPFDPSMLEERIEEKNKASNIRPPADGDSIIVPTREEIEDDDQSFLNRVNASRNERWRGAYGQTPTMGDAGADIESNRSTHGSTEDNTTINTGGANNNDPVANLNTEQEEEDRQTLIIPEAFPVEERSDDGMVIEAVPLPPPLPWWKQRKAKIFFVIVIVIFIILAVSLGLPLSRKAPAETNVIFGTDEPSESPSEKPSTAPSTSASPSDHPTNAPSISLVPTAGPSTRPSETPSSTPSACVNQIVSNANKIDLPLDDSNNPIVAVDGKDMVVVAQEGDWKMRGPVFIIFYTLLNGEWQRKNTFQEDGLGRHSDVALSGKTAFVGFDVANDWTGTVLVYEKDQLGDWGLMEDPFIHDPNVTLYRFGDDVDIDGDSACVTDSSNTYLFHQQNNKWVQFETIDGWRDCSIAGDTIVVRGYDFELGSEYFQLYKYNQELNGVVPIQDPIIPTGEVISFALSNDYLVYWDWDEEDAFMYRWDERNQTFTFHHQFNITGPWVNYGALDNDILVVGGDDKTHIFSEQYDGKWEETITLDQSYKWYVLSGRSLLATNDEDAVYYYDIGGCQAMPTQTPSLSLAPTDSPSSPPSTSPSLTTAPSSSSSPTLLQCIKVAITYDYRPWDTWWGLYRVVGDDDWENELIKEHSGWYGDTSFVDTICLQEGEYEFTIDKWNGICCENGEGNYHVTSNGLLIVEGGEWEGWTESTTFSIPFIGQYPSMSSSPTTAPSTSPSMSPSVIPTLAPSSSISPSMSPSPTTAPSSSTPPTLLQCIKVAITYDDNPWQTSWELYRVVGDGSENEEIQSHQGSRGDSSFVDTLCLQEGEYEFIIWDYWGNGMGEGNYNVTSNGMLIAEGGEWDGLFEITTFSIPFDPLF